MNTRGSAQRTNSQPFADRDLWLNQLQRQFSADMDQKSEMCCSVPHVDGCSSESEEEMSTSQSLRKNDSSVYGTCSGSRTKGKTSVDDRIDDLFRIVNLHSQQMNLLQNQIKSLIDLLHQKNVMEATIRNRCRCGGVSDDVPSDKVEMKKKPIRHVAQDDLNPSSRSTTSDILPKCGFDPDLLAGSTEAEHNFFSTVMGTLRGIMSDGKSDVSTHASAVDSFGSLISSNVDKTMLNATIEQLKKLGVSFIDKSPIQKKVTFYENAVVPSESSVEIDSLARKYLSRTTSERMEAALNDISTMQKRTTDLSLATMKYLKRYKLSSKDSEESYLNSRPTSRPSPSDEKARTSHIKDEPSPTSGKILDSVAIRSQPKLPPNNQWLMKR